MPRKLPNDNREISSERIRDNETWNTCPECFKDWKDIIPIPGLLHRTRLCGTCLKGKNDNNSKRNQRTQ
jgi:hypothetical protein